MNVHNVQEYTVQKCGNWFVERKNKVYHIGVREVQEVREVRDSDWNGCVVRKQVHKKRLERDSGTQAEQVLECWSDLSGV